MKDESQTPQTDPVGRKGGGRKAGSTAPRANNGADILNVDQGLAEEDIPQDSAQAIAPVPFEFQGKAVRTIMKDGGIWFVAMDACAVLEHSNSRMAIMVSMMMRGGKHCLHPGWAATREYRQ